MRRVIVALLATVAATALLVGLKAQGATPLNPVAGAPLDPSVPDSTTSPGAAVPGAAVPGPSAKTPDPRGGTPRPTTTTATTTTKQPSQTTTTAPPAQRTILGSAVATVWRGDNYGTTQVQIVVTGTHIDDIISVRHASRPQTVATTLRQQALAAQSANVGNVSGATASSNAYKQSLQSAISKI